MGRGGRELRRRLRRRTDTQEGAGRQRPGRRWRREEPGKREPGAGGAQLDPGHSHDGGPRWSWRREEPWRRDGRRLQGADQRWQSRWRRSLRRWRRANEPGERRGSGVPGWSRGLRRPRRSRKSGHPQRSRNDWHFSWKNAPMHASTGARSRARARPSTRFIRLHCLHLLGKNVSKEVCFWLWGKYNLVQLPEEPSVTWTVDAVCFSGTAKEFLKCVLSNFCKQGPVRRWICTSFDTERWSNPSYNRSRSWFRTADGKWNGI